VARPHETCPDCGAPPRIPHDEGCRWFDAYARSRKLAPSIEEAAMLNETPDPQPDDDNGGEDEGATIDQ